jgi:hypothetical protein
VVVTFGPPLRFERRVGVDGKTQYEAASRAMMQAIARLADAPHPAPGAFDARPSVDRFEPAGGTGGSAPRPANTT